jgi:hypothetical protein
MSCESVVTPMDIECKPIETSSSYEVEFETLLIYKDGKEFANILSCEVDTETGDITGRAEVITQNKYSQGSVFSFTIHKKG